MSDNLTVTDNRTSKSYEIPIVNNAVKATDFKAISASKASTGNKSLDQHLFGLKVFDPGYRNTAVIESDITYIDGVRGTIQYRDYKMDDLVENNDFEDVSCLLIWGHLPSPQEKLDIRKKLAALATPPQSVIDTISCFPRDTPYHLIFIAAMTAWAATEPENIPISAGKELYLGKPEAVDAGVCRTISAATTIPALIYCHYTNKPFHQPEPDVSPIENLLLMMGVVDPTTKRPDPMVVRILNTLSIIYADHGLTSSTAACMHVGSSLADPMTSSCAAICTGSGPLHAGAIELAYKMFESIGCKENVPHAIAAVKAGKFRLFGYGHRMFKTVDPRVKHIKKALQELLVTKEASPFVSIAMEIDRLASQDEYFRSRNLNVNADLYGCLVYSAMGFEQNVITALMMASRVHGLMAHYREQMSKPPTLWRPLQIFTSTKLQCQDY